MYGAVLLVTWSAYVQLAAQPFSYTDVALIPSRPVWLLLWTNPLMSNGQPNLYFSERIQATTRLYQEKKIETILISWDGISRPWYDETRAMYDALISRDIPATAMILDRYWIDTKTSLKRAQEVYHYNSMTIISQPFHTARALYLAHQFHIDALAYQAPDRKWYTSLRIYIRELFARVKMLV
jgi:SanA protein